MSDDAAPIIEQVDPVSDPPITPPRKQPPEPVGPRVTMVLKLYHQVPGAEIDGPENAPHSFFIGTEDQAYKRRKKVGPEWQPIDIGWTANRPLAILHIRNSLTRLPSTVPTPEERAEFEGRYLEVGKVIGADDGKDDVEPLFLLRIGQEVPFTPIDPEMYRIRCPAGDGQYSVFVVADED